MAYNNDENKLIISRNFFNLKRFESLMLGEFSQKAPKDLAIYTFIDAFEAEIKKILLDYEQLVLNAEKNLIKQLLDEHKYLFEPKKIDNKHTFVVISNKKSNEHSYIKIEKELRSILEKNRKYRSKVNSKIKFICSQKKFSGRPKEYTLNLKKILYLAYISLDKKDFVEFGNSIRPKGHIYNLAKTKSITIPSVPMYYDSDLRKTRKNWLKNHTKSFEKSTKKSFIMFIKCFGFLDKDAKKSSILNENEVTDNMLLNELCDLDRLQLFLMLETEE